MLHLLQRFKNNIATTVVVVMTEREYSSFAVSLLINLRVFKAYDGVSQRSSNQFLLVSLCLVVTQLDHKLLQQATQHREARVLANSREPTAVFNFVRVGS